MLALYSSIPMSKVPQSLGYVTDLAVRSAERSTISRKETYWKIETQDNPTFYWGNFLLFDESERERPESWIIERFEIEFPSARHKAIGFDSKGLRASNFESFSELGLEVDEIHILTTSPNEIEPVSNPIAQTRPLTSIEDWEQYVEVGVATRGPGFTEGPYREYLNAGVPIKQKACESGEAIWFGTFVDQTLVSRLGIYNAGQGVARYQSVATSPEFERMGFATQTLKVASEYAATTFNAKTLVIAADPDFHAITLYKNLGFSFAEVQIQIQQKAS